MNSPNYTTYDLVVFLIGGMVAGVWTVLNTLFFAFGDPGQGIFDFAVIYGAMMVFYRMGVSSGRRGKPGRSRSESSPDESGTPGDSR